MLFRHSSRCPGLSVTTLPFELCPLPGVAACECVILAPRAPNSHHLCNVMPRFHQGLGCLDEPVARPRADPRALLRTHSHVLRVSRALFGTVSLAWSWIPPCRVWSTFCASPGMPRRWSLGLEGLYRKRRSAPFVGLCSALFPAIVHSSALVRRVLLRSPGCSPAEAQSLRPSAAVAAALPHGQWAVLDADMLALIDRSAWWSQFFPPSPRSGHDFPSFPFTGHSPRPGSRIVSSTCRLTATACLLQGSASHLWVGRSPNASTPSTVRSLKPNVTFLSKPTVQLEVEEVPLVPVQL